MQLTTITILLVLLASYSTSIGAATAEEVQKAYENCLPMSANSARLANDTPQAREEYAVKVCAKNRDNMCPTPEGRWCDGWVKQWLFNHSTLKTAEQVNVKLPHTEFFEPPEEFQLPSDK